MNCENNNEKRILIVLMTPLYSNTSGNMRLMGLILGAVENGYKCDLFTMKGDKKDLVYDSFYTMIEKKYINHYYTFQSGVTYKLTKENNNGHFFKTKIRAFLKKIFLFFSVYEASVINVKKALNINIDYNKYDRIISFSDPKATHKIIKDLIIQGRIDNYAEKWIQYWGDPWYIDSTRKYAFGGVFVKREEKKIIELAYRVVYTSPFTLKEQQKIFRNYKSKMRYVNQATIVKDSDKINKNNSKIVIGYFGQYLSNIRNIIPFYECCIYNNYSAIIAGNSDIELEEKNNVKIYQRLSVKEVKDLEEEVDILVCLCNISGTQIPGKLYYQTGYRKPIIVILDGNRKEDMKNFFMGFNRFILCENNIDSIKNAVEKAIEDVKINKCYELDNRLMPWYCAKKILE